jgi:predicted ATPase/DNA-binding SARP family transcriptional activator
MQRMRLDAPTAPSVELRVQLLGGFGVWVDGRPVPDRWRLRKAKSLVKLLALAPEHQLHREVLIERLWPDHPPVAAANNLHQALYAARRAITAAGAPPSVLVLRNAIVALCPNAALVVDSDVFLRSAAAAEDVAGLRAALELWTGGLLPGDIYADWACAARTQLDEERVRVTRRLAALLIGAGAGDEAVEFVEPLAADRPLDEPLHRTLVRSLMAAGRRDEALRAYERLRGALYRELSREPDTASRELYHRLLGDAAQPGPRHNLPAAVTSFVGRRRELAEIEALLSRTRALTLTGPGGSGKTRLAIELARSRASRDDHVDGVWLVEFANLREPDLVPVTVATAIGLRSLGEQAGVAAIVGALRSWRVLLVLDNCEHLIDSVAALAAAVLAGCPTVTVLATSRQPLCVPGEVVWRVPSLQLPGPAPPADLDQLARLESVQLFLERARAALPGFALNTATAHSVALICRRLDGIPLAIELAAARMAHLSAAELCARLEDALDLLSYGSAGRLDRQSTLAATIGWSHDLLTDSERALLRRLSVFAGSFALDAVEALAEGAVPDPLATLARLIDKSLVVADTTATTGRYHLLEVIRQFASARLGADERRQCRRRHRDHYAAKAADLDPDRAGPIVGEPPRWFDTERDNLRAALGAALADDPEQALRLAVSMWRFWMARGMLAEGVRWMTRALAAHPVPSPARAAALYGLAVLHTRLGEAAPLRRIGTELVSIAGTTGNPAELANARHHQTLLALMAGDWPATDELQERTLGEAGAVPTVLTSALHLAAILAMIRGELADAWERLDAARAALAHVPEESEPFFVTMSVAILTERRAGWMCPVGEETMFLARRVGAAQAAGHLRLTAAVQARVRGDLTEALWLLDEADAVFGRLGDDYGEALTVAQRGHALRWAGELPRSRDCFTRAESLRRELGDLRGVALAMDGQALAHAAEGRAEPAREIAGRALAGMKRCGDVAGTGYTTWNLAVVETLLGDLDTAAGLLSHPPVDDTSPGWHRGAGWYQLLLADIVGRLGGNPQPAAREAQRLFDLLGERAGLAELRGLRAKWMQSHLA